MKKFIDIYTKKSSKESMIIDIYIERVNIPILKIASILTGALAKDKNVKDKIRYTKHLYCILWKHIQIYIMYIYSSNSDTQGIVPCVLNNKKVNERKI